MQSIRPFYSHYKITGNSMLPHFQDGDVVIIKKTRSIKQSDIVVAHHPFRKTPIIKQVTHVHDNTVEIHGTNTTESEDSRTFGTIQKKDIIGTVVAIKKNR